MLTTLLPEFHIQTERLSAIGTSGFITILGFSMDGMQHSFSTYPDEWLKIYQSRDYYVADPVFVWSISCSGTRRWSDIDLPDLRGVMRHAQAFGLNYGAITSIKTGNLRSLISVSRGDRELEDDELAYMSDTLEGWVKTLFHASQLSPKQLDVLRCLKDGMSQNEIAKYLSISESTVKQRAQRAIAILNAKTRTQAVAIAMKQGFLDD